MEQNVNNITENTTTDLINQTENQLITDVKSQKEEFEEDETEAVIINREIKSCVTTPYDELKMSPQKDLNYVLIRFDLTFSSEKDKYKWKVYHTPKEVRKHINKLFKKIMNGEYSITKSIHPTIIQLKKDQDIINNLPVINDFYLQLFNEPAVQKDKTLTKFFCISSTSFLKQNGGVKPFEGWAEKKADKHCCRKCFMVCCPCCELCLFRRYNKRWVVVNDDHLYYLNNPKLKEGKVVYFFDKDMRIENDGKDSLRIRNAQMFLNLRFKNFFEKEYWRTELERRKNNYSLLVESNKYNAYTNVKRFNVCQWFSDGKDYFEDLYQKLMEAKYSIYITDWWMSPEVFLRRPVYEKEYIDMAEKKMITRNFGQNMTRLMDVLNYKANQGVQVYILIYYECKLALTLNSKHTEDSLVGINKKIKVTRHPSDAFTLLWSHHEKLVIIDQMIGYVGGLDLCWGRYDNHQHPIYEPFNQQGIYEFPLIDYSNARICDFANVQKYWIESVPRKDTVRMPWHDVHSRIIGPAVSDIARHFIERWNHANFADRKKRGLTSINQSVAFSQNKFNFWQKFTEILKKKNIKLKETKSAKSVVENPFEKLKSATTINTDELLKIGAKENQKLQEEFMKGKKKIDDDHLFQRDDSKSSTKPSYYAKLVKSMGKMGNQQMAIDEEYEITNTEMYNKYFTPGCIMSEVQVLRSASEWSAGLRNTENSILNAYYDLIENAKHYIYIENQFFVSKSWTDEEKKNCSHSISDIVQNKIAYYIRKRIEKAYLNKENFKVYVFLPLLPGFAGEPEESATLQIIVKHTYAGICRNHGLSMIEQLYKIMRNEWKNYIGFYSLRNHALVNGVPKTEIVYIHSKLIIVDDTKVLLGSANINDRSMLGNRDSEFAVLIKEKKQLINQNTGRNFIMDGDNNYRASNFAVSFRRALMAEHLGINPNDLVLDDPASNKLFNFITGRARSNTRIYHNLFGCYPDDAYTSVGILQNAKKNKEKEQPLTLFKKYNQIKDEIKGHIVEFPLFFLKDEDLGKSFFSVENLVPEYNFT